MASNESKQPNKKSKETSEQTESRSKRLLRDNANGKIAGVCAGIANYLDIDVTVIRVIFIFFTLATGGFGILVYLVLALVIPASDDPENKATYNNLSENVSNLSAELASSGGTSRLRNYFATGLIIFGLWLLLWQLFPGWAWVNWDYVWPVTLVALGALILLRSRE